MKFLVYVTGFQNEKRCLFGPTQLITLILNLDLLNDDYLNTGVWPNLEIYVMNYEKFF